MNGSHSIGLECVGRQKNKVSNYLDLLLSRHVRPKVICGFISNGKFRDLEL